ncbi:MAG: hypothetical protein JO252_00195 [Planctomycetaceae bacterium]|nr:hypothetical protein [Planctomycetaceae bacterium]
MAVRLAVFYNKREPSGDGSRELPASLDLPGVLQFGGLQVFAAPTVPAPLRIFRIGEAIEKT